MEMLSGDLDTIRMNANKLISIPSILANNVLFFPRLVEVIEKQITVVIGSYLNNYFFSQTTNTFLNSIAGHHLLWSRLQNLKGLTKTYDSYLNLNRLSNIR